MVFVILCMSVEVGGDVLRPIRPQSTVWPAQPRKCVRSVHVESSRQECVELRWHQWWVVIGRRLDVYRELGWTISQTLVDILRRIERDHLLNDESLAIRF